MKKIILVFVLVVSVLLAHDFGNVPEIRFSQIKKGEPFMIMVGKTKCIWCDSMAPQIKEIKKKYPKTVIYYINVDKDFLGAVNNNIVELPVQLFYNKKGKEVARHIGYMGKKDILVYLREYGVLVE